MPGPITYGYGGFATGAAAPPAYPFCLINGVAFPIYKVQEHVEESGERTRAFDGTYRSTTRWVKRTWRLDTTWGTYEDNLAFRNLLRGAHDVYNFDVDSYSAKGYPNVADLTATVLLVTPGATGGKAGDMGAVVAPAVGQDLIRLKGPAGFTYAKVPRGWWCSWWQFYGGFWNHWLGGAAAGSPSFTTFYRNGVLLGSLSTSPGDEAPSLVGMSSSDSNVKVRPSFVAPDVGATGQIVDRVNSTSYAVGRCIRYAAADGNFYLCRVTTSGMVAGTLVQCPTTIGATFNDGGANLVVLTWDHTVIDDAAILPFDLPAATWAPQIYANAVAWGASPRLTLTGDMVNGVATRVEADVRQGEYTQARLPGVPFANNVTDFEFELYEV